jgi:hypothetical protein
MKPVDLVSNVTNASVVHRWWPGMVTHAPILIVLLYEALAQQPAQAAELPSCRSQPTGQMSLSCLPTTSASAIFPAIKVWQAS